MEKKNTEFELKKSVDLIVYARVGLRSSSNYS